jgi:hypothetical protein
VLNDCRHRREDADKPFSVLRLNFGAKVMAAAQAGLRAQRYVLLVVHADGVELELARRALESAGAMEGARSTLAPLGASARGAPALHGP